MKKSEIKVGGHYSARISGQYVTVRVDRIEDGFPSRSPRGGTRTNYVVTNLATGRKTTFRSAARFRGEARPFNPPAQLDNVTLTPFKAAAILEGLPLIGDDGEILPGATNAVESDEDA